MQRMENITCTRSTGTARMWNKEEIRVVVVGKDSSVTKEAERRCINAQ
jgi:hypothetical protein